VREETMMRITRLAATIALLGLVATPLAAQHRGPKHYKVSSDRAVVVTREVLERRGYEVVRVEERGPDEVVWYRRGNMGRGRGKGPPVKMVIHREADHVVFLDTPSTLLVDIDIRLH
jgi:hypothetical protein